MSKFTSVSCILAIFIILCASKYAFVESTPFGNNCIPSKFFDTYKLYDFINKTQPLSFPISKRAKEIASTLTLQQKIGQMTQLDISMFMNPGTYTLNEQSLTYAIQTYGVGSFLNSPFAGGPIQGVSGYNVTEWINLITQIQSIALNPNNSNTSIPIIYGLDSVHGANYILGAVMFPHNLGVGATFNINIAHQIGKIAARDTRAAGIPWVFAPVADLGAQPLWPRLYETFGEDPYLAAQMSGQVVRGIQDYPNTNLSQSAAACLKHFLGYSDPKSGKDRSPAWIGDRQMRRYFLPAYEAAINAGVRSVMINSGSVNLIPLHSDHQFLTSWLRDELNFTGVAVTDYQDIEKLNFFHHIAKNFTIATGVAVEAGIDMSMVPMDYTFPVELLNLVNYGYISEERITQSAERIIQLKIDLGLFEAPYPSLSNPNVNLVGSEDDRSFAVDAARESVTLLRNQNSILPLNPTSLSKILVTGPAANNQSILHGGWSIHWQGAADNEFVYGQTIYQSIIDVLKYPSTPSNDVSVEYILGTSLEGPVNASGVIDAAQTADVVVLCFGEKPEAEWEGDINNLQSNHNQLELYRLLRNSTSTPIILVLISARPRIIMEAAQADAIMWGYLPAGGGGLAIAEILFGVTNPSGALPITYPQFVNDIGVPYYKTYTDVTSPLYSFGHGLSYTQFTYSNLAVSTNSNGQIYMFDNFTVSVTITNTGSRAGKVPVLLFISDIYASVMPEVAMMKRFEKIELQVAESRTLSWVLTMEDLSYIDRCNEVVVEPGTFNVTVANLYQTFELVPSPSSLLRPNHQPVQEVNPTIVGEHSEQKENGNPFFF